MPRNPKRQCTYPGCSSLTTDTRCEAHPRAGSWSDPRRGTAESRGYGSEWRKIRKQVLERDHYLCQVARKEGRIELASEVDHIISKEEWRRRYGTLDGVDAISNLQSIGHDRHVEKTQREANAERVKNVSRETNNAPKR